MLKIIRKILVWGLIVGVSGYVAVCALLYTAQDRILFPATKTPADQQYSFPIPFEEVWIESDGAKLHGLYFPAQGESKGIIIFFHGNSERAEQFGDSAEEFTSRGYDYFIPDYRGYGKSTGVLTSEAQFLADIDRIYDWARAKYPDEKMVFAGRSMGAVPAIYLASKHNPKLTVMIAAFYDIAAMKAVRYPFLPNFLLNYDFPNYRWIAETKSPVYLIHGTEDETVPYEQSLRLAPLARAPHKHFTVPGAGHNNLQDFPLYHEILYRILISNEQP